eukprot:6660207-Ditylum_brightwellii.AAC.1
MQQLTAHMQTKQHQSSSNLVIPVTQPTMSTQINQQSPTGMGGNPNETTYSTSQKKKKSLPDSAREE